MKSPLLSSHLSGLDAVLPHSVNTTAPASTPSGGMTPQGGGSSGGIPPGEVPVGITTGGTWLPPVGRSSVIFKKGQAQVTFQPTQQGARVIAGRGSYASAWGGLEQPEVFPSGGLFGLADQEDIDGLGDFFGDVGGFFKKAVRYTGAIVVAPFAPASFTRKTFGLSPRESSQFETYAKVTRGVAAGTAAVAGGLYAAGYIGHAAAAPAVGAGSTGAGGTIGVPGVAVLSESGRAGLFAASAPIVSTPALAAEAAATPSLISAGFGTAAPSVAAPSLVPLSVGATGTASPIVPVGLTSMAFSPAAPAAVAASAPLSQAGMVASGFGSVGTGSSGGFWAGALKATGGALVGTAKFAGTTMATGYLLQLMNRGVPMAGMGETVIPMAGTGYDGGVQAGMPYVVSPGGGAGGVSEEAPPESFLRANMGNIVVVGLVVTVLGTMLLKRKPK